MIVLLDPAAGPEGAQRVLAAVRALGLDAVPLADGKGDAFEVLGEQRGKVLSLRGTPGVQEILTRRRPLEGGEPVWPHFILRLGILACVLLALLLVLSAFLPPGLGDEARIDSRATAVEWYLRPVASFLDLFPKRAETAGILIIGLFWVLLFAWPFLDRVDPATPSGKKLQLGMRVLGVLAFLLILVLALRGGA